MIERPSHVARLRELLEEFPVVGLIGARQVGKTTLARTLAERTEGEVTVFDLESSRDLARLQDPLVALEGLGGLVVLDEIQLRPELFPSLRVLCDRVGSTTRFLVLGSASPNLLRQGSETLAGRIAYHELPGFDVSEVDSEHLDRLWLRGGFPRSFLARSEPASTRWRNQFIRTYLERDLAELDVRLPAETMRRFWSMIAHYHGETWNASELARAFGVSYKTVQRYLDTLCSTFMARRLEPWFENLAKRQVKAPKIYLTDSGILHALLGIRSREDLFGHPKVGASWEGYVIHEILRHLGAEPGESFFWGLHTGAELDLLVRRGSTRLGFEVKLTSGPRVTRSMRSAKEALGLDEVIVVFAGDESFPMTRGIRAVGFRRLREEIPTLDGSAAASGSGSTS